MPFPITALQVEGRPEFLASSEIACHAKGLGLFLVPPRYPQLNDG